MANFVVSSRSRFARNSILVENNSFRSSPLLVAAKRYKLASEKSAKKEYLVEKYEWKNKN